MGLCIRWYTHVLLLHPLLQVVYHAKERKGGAESRVEADACRTKLGGCSVKLTLKYIMALTCMPSHTANQAIRSRVRVGIIRSSRATVHH